MWINTETKRTPPGFRVATRNPAVRSIIVYWALAIFFASETEAFHPIASGTELLGIYPAYPVVNYRSQSDPEAVRRGEYLAKIGDCIACHTDTRKDGPAFAGGLPIDTPFGTFYSPNITPDETTGIGRLTEKQFIRAMHQGILSDGSNAFPAFPYVYFNRVRIDDLKDLWAYLKAIPAVNKPNRGNTLPVVLDWRILQYGWKILYFYPDRGYFKPDPTRSTAWNRGAYLVNGLGHCSMCHTPMNLFGAEQKKYFLTGAFIEGYWAPDITHYGLSTASRFQVADVFIDGELINKAGPVRGPMAEVNHDSLSYLTETDRLAIAEYLKSVESREPRNIPRQLSSQSPLQRGEQVYENVCVICHLNGRVGAPRIGDEPNWEERVRVSGLATLYRHAINGFNKMPAKGGCLNCSDGDIIAGADYLIDHSLSDSFWESITNHGLKSREEMTNLALGKKIYQENCRVCHAEGQLGAPRLADREQWKTLIRKNLDVLMLNTLKGVGNMPARGGCAQCSGSEVIAAVKYMVQQSLPEGNYSLW
ncbi:MAG: c-type cytochrome [Gammaproteobacteria bacterium]